MLYIESAAVLLLLFITILPGMKVYRKGEYNNEYLSLNNTRSLRGILSVLIVIHHLSSYYVSISFLSIFKHIGYLVVAMFFFLSGYGLIFGCKNKKNYLNKFLLKRLPNIVIPYYISTIIYAIIFNIMGLNISFINVITSFVCVDYIIPSAWYIAMQSLMYVIFYISLKFPKTEKSKAICFSVLFLIIQIGFMFLPVSDVWVRSLIAFPLGLVWCKYKDVIDGRIRDKYTASFFIFGILLVIILAIKLVGEFSNVSSLKLLGNVLSSSTIVVFMFIFFNKCSLKNKVLDFLGSISLEVYLLHNLILTILSKIDFVIENILLFALSTFFITILLSYFIHLLNVKLVQIFKKIVKVN